MPKEFIPLSYEDLPVKNNRMKSYPIEVIAESIKINGSFVAVLSCLYEDVSGDGQLLAKRILKPNIKYSDKEAYNALFDLRMLELFLLFQPFNNKPCALCTCDKALAAFWCAIQPAHGALKTGIPTYQISITEKLFARMTEAERTSLFHFR
ncbi:MAG: hypothetical protein ACLFNS_08470 [Desulfobacterales bacterium]